MLSIARRLRFVLRRRKADPRSKQRKYNAGKALLDNHSAVQFLAFGFTFNVTSFLQTADRLEELMRQSPGVHTNPNHVQVKQGHIELLKDALIGSTRRAISEAGADAVRIGITGGMDSRLLYSAVRELLPEHKIFTYTIGYRGQYDYEFARLFGDRFLSNHHLLDTSLVEWDFDEEVDHKRKASQPTAYSPKRHLANYMVTRMGAPAWNVHGFMGDALLSGSKPNRETPIQSWEDAVGRFIKKNDPFKLQGIFQRRMNLSTLLPKNPNRKVEGMDDYDFLDFGLRQYQRIMGVDSRSNPKTIIPYTDDGWTSALLSIGMIQEREPLYYDFLSTWAPDIFFEFKESDISSRAEHQVFRSKVTRDAKLEISDSGLKNPDGSTYRQQVTTANGGVLIGRQFCEYAEYHNNPTFRRLVDTSLGRLRQRRLFPRGFIDDVLTRCQDGELDAASQIKGLVCFELNLSGGHLNDGR